MSEFKTGLNNQFPYQPTFNATPIASKGLEDIKKQENVAGVIADKYDGSDNPGSLSRSFLYSLLMSMGFVKATNWAMKPKTIPDSMTQMDSYTSSRLYKMGAKLDNSRPLKWVSNQMGKIKSALSKIPVPNFIKEVYQKTKVGSVAPWDKTGMYSIGKSAEAMTEASTFLSQVSDKALKNLKLDKRSYRTVIEILKKVRTKKLDGIEAYKQLEPILRRVSAKALKELKIPTLFAPLSRFMGTLPDANLALSKARFFAGQAASGPVGKFVNKAAALIGEASGGGVLGGSGALVMNALGLMAGFNSAAKAEKGDKLKAFMEDYIGFTLGGYLMSMVVGTAFNKVVGNAELAMDLNSIKDTAKQKLKLENCKRVQDVVIAYNNEFSQVKKLNKVLKKLEKGKIVPEGSGFFATMWHKLTGKIELSKVEELMKECDINCRKKDIGSVTSAIRRVVNTKDNAWFKSLRDEITAATKAGVKNTEGTMLNKIGRFVFQKPLAAISKLLSTGRYTLLKNGNFIGNLFRRAKRVGGGIFRMWLVGFVLVEPFRRAFIKLSHKIFGKPKNSALDEENQQNNPTQNPQISPAPNGTVPNGQSQNLVDLYLQNMPHNPQQPNQSAPSIHAPYLATDTATYVPNQVLGQESYIDTGVTKDLLMRRDLALANSFRAEERAKKILSGDFS